MWMAGAIGVACGTGELVLAFMAMAISLIVLLIVGFVGR